MSTKLNATQRDQANRVLNQAADDVLELIDTDVIRDAINLVVNVFGHYLGKPDGDVESAIESSYDHDYDEVMSWFDE